MELSSGPGEGNSCGAPSLSPRPHQGSEASADVIGLLMCRSFAAAAAAAAAEPSYPRAPWHARFTGVQSVVMLWDFREHLKRSVFTSRGTTVCVSVHLDSITYRIEWVRRRLGLQFGCFIRLPGGVQDRIRMAIKIDLCPPCFFFFFFYMTVLRFSTTEFSETER